MCTVISYHVDVLHFTGRFMKGISCCYDLNSDMHAESKTPIIDHEFFLKVNNNECKSTEVTINNILL